MLKMLQNASKRFKMLKMLQMLQTLENAQNASPTFANGGYLYLRRAGSDALVSPLTGAQAVSVGDHPQPRPPNRQHHGRPDHR